MCTNEWSPADGRVVHLNYGCGAHSETGQLDEDREIPRSQGVIVDELDVEIDKDAPAEAPAGDAPAEGTPAEQKPVGEKPAEETPVDEVPEADSPED